MRHQDQKPDMESQNGENEQHPTVQEAGRKGGETTAKRHGPQFYHDIRTKGGNRVRELIEEGKEAQSEEGSDSEEERQQQ